MRAIGDVFEQRACDYLVAHGLSIVATNWHVHQVGELDIVAYADRCLPASAYPTLVCVEVRARRRSAFASAGESVTLAKQRKLINSMQYFLQAHPEYQHCDVRFDVLAFDEKVDGSFEITWLQAAFLPQD